MQGPAQAMLPALEAILGHRSAHSLATGPVMAEPVDTHTRKKHKSQYLCYFKSLKNKLILQWRGIKGRQIDKVVLFSLLGAHHLGQTSH